MEREKKEKRREKTGKEIMIKEKVKNEKRGSRRVKLFHQSDFPYYYFSHAIFLSSLLLFLIIELDNYYLSINVTKSIFFLFFPPGKIFSRVFLN